MHLVQILAESSGQHRALANRRALALIGAGPDRRPGSGRLPIRVANGLLMLTRKPALHSRCSVCRIANQLGRQRPPRRQIAEQRLAKNWSPEARSGYDGSNQCSLHVSSIAGEGVAGPHSLDRRLADCLMNPTSQSHDKPPGKYSGWSGAVVRLHKRLWRLAAPGIGDQHA
jgi:hypothetical protein